MESLLRRVKQNLQITFFEDDDFLLDLIDTATSYAAAYQHRSIKEVTEDMSETTAQAIVMLATHLYEARDGATGGFWADKTDAARAAWDAVNRLLVLDREWKI